MLEGFSIANVLKIIVTDLVLSGDNAVVIAMAARSLPPKQQKQAIFFGGATAIVLRVLITIVVAYALQIPLLQFVGGLMLIWIAVKLLRGGEDEEQHVKEAVSIKDAIFTIVLADFIMSLDNMLAVGGVSEGNIGLLLMGLLVSMSIIMFFSSIVAKWMNKWPWLVYIGGAILGYTAGEMILRDRWLGKYIPHSTTLSWLFPAVVVVGVIAVGHLLARRDSRAAASTEAAATEERKTE